MEYKAPPENEIDSPIAVIGMACRFPGEATNPENFWDMISQGKTAYTDVPGDRFNIDGFYNPHPESQGSTYARGGHFLQEDIAGFDRLFFSTSPKEAHAMDPQHRMALEVSYEALENAGLTMDAIANTAMGCYMASFTKDYLQMRGHDFDDLPVYELAGNGTNMLSNRVSWFFNLKGPSLSLDTACSSSLVALHLACQSIRTGESTSAIVGGSSLIIMPEMHCAMSSLHLLSPDSRSMAFDSKANGYGRGEGTAVVVLKPLAAALRDGDVIRALIRATGVNHDGKTHEGIGVPSSSAQEELIRSTYLSCGLPLTDTHYVEAHGTGTQAGDPAECRAIGNTLGKSRSNDKDLVIGSVKTNIGHLEAVAGLAGLIKSILALEKGQIPPNLWFDSPNPRIQMDEWRLKVPTELVKWPAGGPRRASVNSFGYGGTNAHCIIDDAAHYLEHRGLRGNHNTSELGKVTARESNGETCETYPRGAGMNGKSEDKVKANGDGHEHGPACNAPWTQSRSYQGKIDSMTTLSPRILVWSAHEQNVADRVAENLSSYIEHRDASTPEGGILLDRLAQTLHTKRSSLAWRSFAVASSLGEARSALEGWPKSKRVSPSLPKLCFAFTGQGAQWYAMGRELFVYPKFRAAVEDAASFYKELGAEWNLMSELFASEKDSRLREAQLSPTTTIAIQVALIDLLDEWNIKPAVVVGHSSGEIAAAYAIKAISRESAWTIAYHRGRLVGTIARDGSMLAVGLGEEAVRPIVGEVKGGELVVGCINSPNSVTLAGDTAAILEAQALLEDRKIFNKRLGVSAAHHSSHMDAIALQYMDSLEALSPPPGETQTGLMFSSLKGGLIDPAELAQPSYWVTNLAKPVQFAQAMQAALERLSEGEGATKTSCFILEVGPHSALQGPIQQILAARGQDCLEAFYASCLSRKEDAIKSILKAVGFAFQHGHPVDIGQINALNQHQDTSVALVDLPPYPLESQHQVLA